MSTKADLASSITDIDKDEIEKNLTDNPERLSVNYFSFNSADFAFGILVGLLFFLAKRFYGNPAAIGVGALGAVLLYRLNFGRVYYSFGEWAASIWIRLVRKGLIHEVSPKRKRLISSKNRSLPFTFVLYSIRNTEVGDIGLAYDKKTKYDTLVVVGDGSGILAKSLAQMNEIQWFIADAIKKVASIGGHNVGVSFVAQSRPCNMEKLIYSYAENLHPDVARAAALVEGKTEDELTVREERILALNQINIVELPAEIKRYAREFTMAVVLSVQRPRKGPLQAITKRRRSRLTVREARRLAVVKVAKATLDEFARVGVTNPRVLDLKGLQGYFRDVWDVNDNHRYHAWQAQADDEAVVDSDKHWPQASVRSRKDHLVVDERETSDGMTGSYHATILLRSSPPKTLPDFYLHLYPKGIRYLRVASVGVPISYRSEYQVLKRAVPLRESLIETLGIVHRDPKMQDTDSRLEKRQWDLFRSGFAHKHAILVTVSATTLEELEEAVEEAMRSFQLHKLRPKLVPMECRQKLALLTSAGIAKL